MFGQAEHTIQTHEDMLKAFIIDLKGSWDDHLQLIEFSYNNGYHSCIGMELFEALYGRSCRSQIGFFEVGESDIFGPKIVHEAMKKVKLIREMLATAYRREKSHKNNRKRDLEYEVGDHVYLKISPMKGLRRFL